MTAATFALLIDGSTAEIRDVRPADAQAVREMHAAMSPETSYLRFFSLSPVNAEREAQRVCREPGPDHAALLAWLGKDLVGVASYEPTAKPGVAEIAFAVPDRLHGRGIATLLLEHLVSIARQRGVEAFTAETLSANSAMQGVFAAAGLPVRRTFVYGDVEHTIPLTGEESGPDFEGYLDHVAARESRADVASLRHLLRPASIAVIGASRRRGSAGREILHNIVASGFGGQIYPVNPRGRSMEGLRCLPSMAGLPEGVDLAVIAVPAEAVTRTAAECGRRGVRSLVVITGGLGAAGADLLAICRRYGMRLAGPDCFGVAVPGIGLDATLSAGRPLAGDAGVIVQSCGVGASVLEHLSRLGIGVSSFASVGDKYDVSSNDLLTWWEQDGQTTLAIVCVESFGSPRKFARTARRVGQRMPVLTVISGRGRSAQRPAHGASASAATQEALFAQAGIVAAYSLGELLEAAALLASQPLPAGNRVAIVTNASGAGTLAADACEDHGLEVAIMSRPVQRRLARLLPARAAVTGPVDTTSSVSASAFQSCLEEIAADDNVDAVLAVIVPTALADLTEPLQAAQATKPLTAALLDQPETVRMLPHRGDPPAPADGAPPATAGGSQTIPGYADPESAARALGHAARYRAWRDRQQGHVPVLDRTRPADAKALAAAFLMTSHAGAWLPDEAASELLSCYGIQIRPAGEGGRAELVVRVEQESVFGSLVVLALGGAAAALPGARAARLAPLTDADAGDLIRGWAGAPLLSPDGPAAAAALGDLLLRVSRLADDIPEITELELSPVIAGPGEVRVAGARVRICPAQPHDPFLRRLR
jgi:acyl-CoA synthetase (NDP forming)/GNAT superfamily N-acetyltransferase